MENSGKMVEEERVEKDVFICFCLCLIISFYSFFFFFFFFTINFFFRGYIQKVNCRQLRVKFLGL